MKPPVGTPVPACITQAEDMIKLLDEGLDKEQVVSVGRKPAPLNEMLTPADTVVWLKEMTGSDSTLMTAVFAANNNNAPTKNKVVISLKDVKSIIHDHNEL